MLTGTLLAKRYQLTELVDMGGSSLIYKAVDTKNNAVVAAKILKQEFTANPEFVDRFKKEVQVALRLKHANIIRAFDAGVDGDKYYIIMDFIDGKTLKHIITINKALPVNFVVSVAKKLCLALEYAHVKGFIHRDIKPHNILIDMEGEPYIGDFGIAKKIAPAISEIKEENVMGSVHYFSPEQARGEKVDKRSDIYSLGIVLYEMLTGEVPFDGETSVEIALKHLNHPMPETTDKASGIPQSLNRIIQKATQKDKDLRYKSAFSMYEDLSRALAEKDGSFVKLQKSKEEKTRHEHMRAEKRTHTGSKTILAGALGVLATIIVFLVVFNYNFKDSVQDVIVPDIVNATEQAATEEILSSDLTPAVDYDFSDTIGMGLVISQDPAPGSEAKEGQTVTIYVSAGPDLPVMTGVIGMPLEDAIDSLNKEGITNIEVIEQTDGDYVDGTVISQVPAENDKIKDTDTVTLTVKAAPDALLKKAPNVIDLSLIQALETLKSSGFTKFYIYEEESEQPSGIVTNQTPALNVSQEVSLPFTLWISEYNNIYSFTKPIDIQIDDDNTIVKIALKMNISGSDVYFIIRESSEDAGNLQLEVSSSLGLPYEDSMIEAQMVVFLNDVAEQTFDVTLHSGG
jgi:serine/threonine-protein kinase